MNCPSCEYHGSRRGLGSHYGSNPDHRPELSEKQHEIVTGLLMGDGHVNRSGNTPNLRAEMIAKEYLDYLDEAFGDISLGVEMSRTAEQQSAYHRDTGFNSHAGAETYSDCYWWETMAHQAFSEYADWYKSGSKVFPEELSLTPTILKHWYVCDGNLSTDRQIRIYLDNEREYKDKINNYFSGMAEPRWDEQPHYTAIIFTVEDSEEILSYIGEPLPGFEHKWTEKFK